MGSLFTGISIPTGSTAEYTITGNTFSYIVSTPAVTSTITCIYINTTGTNQTISNNSINHITTSGNFTGLDIRNTSTTTTINSNIFGNTDVNNMTFSGVAKSIYPINIPNNGTYICTNNTIQQFNAQGGGATLFYGFYLAAAGSNYTLTGNTFNDLSIKTTSPSYLIYSPTSGIATISNNNFGSTSANNISYSSTGQLTAIYCNSTGTYTCNNNTIQQISTAGLFNGIYATGQLTASNNTLKNITSTNSGSTNFGIYAYYNSLGHSITNNLFQDLNLSGATTLIFVQSNTNSNINSNTLGSSSSNNITLNANAVQYAIYMNGTATFTCNSNTIQNINCTNTGTTSAFSGIHVNSGAALFSSNIITNITSSSKNTSTTNTLALNGIYITSGVAAVTNVLSSNNISNLVLNSTTAGNYSVTGININHSTSINTIISKNRISGLETAATSASAVATGLYFQGASVPTASNNVILLNNGSSSGNSIVLNGIRNSTTGVTTLYHNTTKLYGTTTSLNGSSSAYRNGAVNRILLKNNIFQNTRTNSGGSGKHYAIAYSTIPTAVVGEDYNYLEASGSRGNIGYKTSDQTTLANWQTASGTGTNDKTGTVSLDGTGKPTNGSTSDVASNGTDLSTTITDDIDGTMRPITPYRGAYEVSSIIALPQELIAFSANYNTQTLQVDLHWEMASEHNINYYTVQRSLDGYHFETISANENISVTEKTLNYLTYDFNPYKRISYYRLVITNIDGQKIYSELQSVFIDSDEDFSVNVFPNPGTIENMHINISVKNNLPIEIILMDETTGRRLFQDHLEGSENYSYSLKDKINHYMGVVFCHLNYATKSTVLKFTLY